MAGSITGFCVALFLADNSEGRLTTDGWSLPGLTAAVCFIVRVSQTAHYMQPLRTTRDRRVASWPRGLTLAVERLIDDPGVDRLWGYRFITVF